MTMVRDKSLFPDDANGDRLWRIFQINQDQLQEVEVEFSTILPTQELALEFGQFLLEKNQKLSFCQYHGDENNPWEITAYPTMDLTYENVANYQALLEGNVQTYKGHYDGWFCAAANEPHEA